MKILFVAKHNSGGGDDEGAIAHALVSLGHDVTRLGERDGHLAYRLSGDMDLLLFCKWHDSRALRRIRCPRAFWYFDLVDYPADPTLASRCLARRRWMADIVPLVDVGFCTDGDWVEQDASKKLVWLSQGADGRIVGQGRPCCSRVPILFTGIRHGGGGRAGFVDEMQVRYGGEFRHVQAGQYQRDLASLIASSDIVVAPDAPVTHAYWSNRVWNALGFGAFLLHPYCERLASMYEDRREIVYYHDREELHDLIAYYRTRDDERRAIAAAGLARTQREHLYVHRCERLIQVVKERCGR